ncbi:hypothetical protein VPP93_gp13 [Vibrio phage VP93]|uniref:HNH nuclease domain-containing protein n=1 Tax=Vibrio phage VP93 TaxID=641832 RepID=C3VVQ3_9CAUD|nr:HNH endonuclease [Vibrio phage VP93]ACP44084.1 hypothetical protein VPP93_gp13 [Vibrio phage VP93]
MGLKLSEIKHVVVRHTCDNPRCINPDHLIGGTIADNNRDRAERGRSAKTVPSRQKLTLADCCWIREHYVPYCRSFGGGAMARKFNVDIAVIHRVLKGDYPL